MSSHPLRKFGSELSMTGVDPTRMFAAFGFCTDGYKLTRVQGLVRFASPPPSSQDIVRRGYNEE